MGSTILQGRLDRQPLLAVLPRIPVRRAMELLLQEIQKDAEGQRALSDADRRGLLRRNTGGSHTASPTPSYQQ